MRQHAHRRFPRPLIALATSVALGCSDDAAEPAPSDTSSPGDTVQTDGSDATDGTDATDGSDASDTTDGTDATDGSDASDATDGSDGTDATDGTDGLDGADAAALLAIEAEAEWSIPGLTGDVHVVRTDAGVPHIYAKTRSDLGRVVGFTLARDRFFFMDLQRRLGLGKVSALLGDVGLGSDMSSRLTGSRYITERLVAALSDEAKAYFEGIAVGVNAYIDAVKADKLPAPTEFQTVGPLLGQSNPADLMAPFAVEDVMAMAAVLMIQTNFETGDVGQDQKQRSLDTLFDGALKAELRRTGFIADVWNDVRPLAPGSGSTSAFGTSGLPAGKPGVPPAPSSADPVTAPARRPIHAGMANRLIEKLARLDARFGKDGIAAFGSNAWAAGKGATKDGSAIVCSDGHLSLSVPALMYRIGLDTSVFGGGDIHQVGGFLTPFPILGVGTNGSVAWGMVNPVVDVTDWYREELQLDESGAPVASKFQGEWKPLVATEESYVVADVPVLGSVGRTETWKRFETFDGRWLLEIEGKKLDKLEDAAEGEFVVNLQEDLIVPGDEDGDGVITAISFDYTAFDAGRWTEALYEMGLASDVYDYREKTRGLVGGGLFMAAGDDQGNVLYSSYQAIPCRGYLEKTGGIYGDGSDPTRLLDGTVYGGFAIPSTPTGAVDEAKASDPYACAIPFDVMPQSVNPPSGFVFTANNDPADITDDGDHLNDEWYLGGPWYDLRANTIRRELQKAKDAGGIDLAAMQKIQANKTSRYGEAYAPLLVAALDWAATAATAEMTTPDAERAAALYTARKAAMDEVRSRLTAWGSEGAYDASSGVETFYESPTELEKRNAVATMIFNAWHPRFIAQVWGDEPVDAFRYSGNREKAAVTHRFLLGRGASNPEGYASHDPATGEAVFFDRLGTDEVESSNELMIVALDAALAFLESAPTGGGNGGFGNTDMDTWLWGLRHQVKFESLVADYLTDDPTFSVITDLFSITTATLPLAPDLPAGDPRKDLKWFPRGGDNEGVDAANSGWSGTGFSTGSGPVMRLAVRMKGDETEAEDIIPGGQSGLTSSEHFADQAKLWLANEALPAELDPKDVAKNGKSRELFRP